GCRRYDLIRDRPRTVRNRLSPHHRGGIAFNQGLGVFRSSNLGGEVARLGEDRHAALVIVCVGREKVDRGAVEQPARNNLGPLPPETRQRRGRDLHQAALLDPLNNALWRLLEDGVSLRMSQDRSQSAIAKSRKAVRDLNRDAIVAEFYQQIVGFANGVEVRLLEHALQVLVGEMKIASQT